MASDSTYHDRFLERALDPKAWEDTACQLLEAAKVLEPKLDEFWSGATHHPWSDSWRVWADEFVAIYFMLSAYAIENLMKARIVRDGRTQLAEEFQRSRRLPSVLKTHDLCELAVRSGNAGLAKGYEDILKRLTRSATWYGRYPVPLAPNGLEPFSRSSDGSPLSLTHYSSSDRGEIQRVIAELRPLEPTFRAPREAFSGISSPANALLLRDLRHS